MIAVITIAAIAAGVTCQYDFFYEIAISVKNDYYMV